MSFLTKCKKNLVYLHQMRHRPSYLRHLLLWLLVLAAGCSVSFAADTASDGSPIWSADNIKIVYLEDSTQFVCDPDGLLNVQYRDSANYYLNKLHQEFDIQSVFVVVNHVKNADAFRMAQDLGNKYGVGYKDTRTGLVIVIAVADRQFFIARRRPARASTRKLRPANCHRPPRPAPATVRACPSERLSTSSSSSASSSTSGATTTTRRGRAAAEADSAAAEALPAAT